MKRLLRKIFSVVISVFFSCSVAASPWIDVGEDRLRNNLQLLVDTGVINTQISAWPVMWADIDEALEGINQTTLNPTQKAAIKELQFELAYQTKKRVKQSVVMSAASSRPLFSQFSTGYREELELRKTFDWDGQNMAVKLQTNLTSDSGDDATEFQLDGSYAAGVLGNWVIGAGAIDRWWGPSRQNSLILSNNARPVPGVFLRTKANQSFESKWLSWIGDWHFTSFIGQMERNRHVPEAKLTGMRLTIKPFDNLEIGLSRAMQWGGEGRSEDLETFLRSITSKGENSEEQAGNQLGGLDVRYGLFDLTQLPIALYMQTIGEDEAGYLPSRRTYQFGLEGVYALTNSASSLNGFIEYTNTTADPFADEFLNITYEHSVYQSGYRYRGRVMGSTFDNDAKVLSTGLAHHQRNGVSTSLLLSYAELNQDGVRRGNTVSSSDVDIYFAELTHQRIVLDGRLKLGMSYYSDHVPTVQDDVDEISLFASWEYRF